MIRLATAILLVTQAIGASAQTESVPLPGAVPLLVKEAGESPSLGEEAHAVAGEPIYAKFDYGVWQVARLPKALHVNAKLTIPGDEPLLGYVSRVGRKNGQVIYCLYRGQGTSAMTLSTVYKWACLQDLDDDGSFDRVVFPARPAKKLKSSVDFSIDTVNTLPDQLEAFGGNHYRKEILYQGVAGGVLRLLYREFTNDMARPAFSQELTYDLLELPMSVTFKSVRLEVSSAGNDGIDFKLLSGLSD